MVEFREMRENFKLRNEASYLVLIGFVALVLFATYFIYSQVQEKLKQQLQTRILAIASTASLAFDSEELVRIKDRTSVGTPLYVQTIRKLNELRHVNTDLKYIYILRMGEKPNSLYFIADADSIDPDAKIDLNQDGVIDDQDALAAPGDEYPLSEDDNLKAIYDNHFSSPTVDSGITHDKWGGFVSASAPIYNKKGVPKAVIGIDVRVDDFIRIRDLTMIPFILFVLFLLLTLTLLTVILVRMWGERVNAVKQLDRQKDELLGLVSHQLAAPVSAVRWYLEMLIDGDLGELNDEQKKQMQSIYSSTNDLSDLISMILDVSRIQLGRINIEKQELNLQDFIKDILTVVEPKAIAKKLNFTKNVPTTLPVANLDKRYTRMTVENLLTNAIKYTADGGTVVFNVDISQDTLRISVKDTGCGIPKADQKKIFGSMYRASNVRNSAIDGNGFGLYVAKGAVEGQGGKIWFESAEGVGTTFFVELPISKPHTSKV